MSLDSLETLRAFSEKVGAVYPMGSDRGEREAVRAFGVPVSQGGFAQRSLFVIDPAGVLRYVDYDYRIREDYPEVFRTLRAIQGEDPPQGR